MIARRELLSGTAFGGWLGRDRAADSPAPQGSRRDADMDGVVRAIDRLRSTIDERETFAEIAPVREQQKQFLRQQGKLPDFIEVGVDVWFDVYDWHVRNLQPVTLGRDAGGHYTIALLSTVVVMRPDLPQARYVGLPYDNR